MPTDAPTLLDIFQYVPPDVPECPPPQVPLSRSNGHLIHLTPKSLDPITLYVRGLEAQVNGRIEACSGITAWTTRDGVESEHVGITTYANCVDVPEPGFLASVSLLSLALIVLALISLAKRSPRT